MWVSFRKVQEGQTPSGTGALYQAVLGVFGGWGAREFLGESLHSPEHSVGPSRDGGDMLRCRFERTLWGGPEAGLAQGSPWVMSGVTWADIGHGGGRSILLDVVRNTRGAAAGDAQSGWCPHLHSARALFQCSPG